MDEAEGVRLAGPGPARRVGGVARASAALYQRSRLTEKARPQCNKKCKTLDDNSRCLLPDRKKGRDLKEDKHLGKSTEK